MESEGWGGKEAETRLTWGHPNGAGVQCGGPRSKRGRCGPEEPEAGSWGGWRAERAELGGPRGCDRAEGLVGTEGYEAEWGAEGGCAPFSEIWPLPTPQEPLDRHVAPYPPQSLHLQGPSLCLRAPCPAASRASVKRASAARVLGLQRLQPQVCEPEPQARRPATLPLGSVRQAPEPVCATGRTGSDCRDFSTGLDTR